MRYSQFIKHYSISEPLEPEAVQALAAWEARYRAEFRGLAVRFSKLHLAIDAQKLTTTREELKRLFGKWETVVLNTYMTVGDTLVPKLEGGYGNAATIADFEAAVRELPKYQKHYRHLRASLEAFLDDETGN
ncbi:hypothetical protein GCM10027272_10350 [Hymenobacter frigidus]